MKIRSTYQNSRATALKSSREGAHVAILRIVLNDLLGLPDDRSPRQGHHGHAEEGAQGEAEQQARSDRDEGRDEEPLDEDTQEGEVLAAEDRDGAQSGEAGQGHEPRAGDHAASALLLGVQVSDGQEGSEDDRLEEDEAPQGQVLGRLALRTVGHARGQVAEDHERHPGSRSTEPRGSG